MGNKHLKRSSVPQYNPKKTAKTNYIRHNPEIMRGWKKDGNEANPIVSLRFVQEQHQCFSEWQKVQMNHFWDFNRKVHEYTWAQIYNSGGKKEKAGLAYTPIPFSLYPNQDFVKSLDPETEFFELRVSGEMRVHGFRDEAIFHICWLDKDHGICP